SLCCLVVLSTLADTDVFLYSFLARTDFGVEPYFYNFFNRKLTATIKDIQISYPHPNARKIKQPVAATKSTTG
ncbi:hypothetical protein, partial [Lysinibacillus sp. NPDC047702]